MVAESLNIILLKFLRVLNISYFDACNSLCQTSQTGTKHWTKEVFLAKAGPAGIMFGLFVFNTRFADQSMFTYIFCFVLISRFILFLYFLNGCACSA